MYKFAIILLTFLFLLSGCDKKEDSNQTKAEIKTDINRSVSVNKATQEEAVKFTLTTIEGKEFHLTEIDNGLEFKELKDKAIFLLFFGHRCPPCLREIPELIEIQKEHKDLAIVAIEVQGLGEEQLKDFAKVKGINYNLITLNSSMRFVNYIQAKAGWSGSIPFLIGLNKKGRVIIINVGGVSKEQLEQAHKELIKE